VLTTDPAACVLEVLCGDSRPLIEVVDTDCNSIASIGLLTDLTYSGVQELDQHLVLTLSGKEKISG